MMWSIIFNRTGREFFFKTKREWEDTIDDIVNNTHFAIDIYEPERVALVDDGDYEGDDYEL